MLRQRVITAIALLGVLFAALLAPGALPLVALLTLAATCALWEWLRLTWPHTGPTAPLVATLVLLALGSVGAAWLSMAAPFWFVNVQMAVNHWLMPLVGAIWVFGASVVVVRGNTGMRGSACLCVFGVLAVLAAWAALAQMFVLHGAWFLVSLLALIWAADIAAYFTGRAFGRHKLAPRVSPGKTWEGALGGVLASMLWVILSAHWAGSFGALLMRHWPVWLVAIVAAALGALSIIGDLFESLLKRRAGMKDSSGLLPGHGGVYDRLDALLPVAPIALLLTLRMI
ncbi:MAG: phosphatidate cytidylyltransferase [Candidimonas sp.]|nr:MAG: phosphatidate cytidylyltransferase [Candidimonas sp.]TAM26191.1 MAG: phosphatidate cytidylyltransferase [Candidimonas sp.]TAM77023.1 MAG: phosphatidate cytidylyltransferase [Candidimonas sp.]